MNSFSLDHFEMKDFINQELPIEIIENIWKIKSEYKTFNFLDYKIFNEGSNEQFILLKLNIPSTKEDWNYFRKNFDKNTYEKLNNVPKELQYINHYELEGYLKNNEIYCDCNRYININNVVKYLSDFDDCLGKNILEVFYKFAQEEAKEITLLQDNIWVQQNAMQKYLRENNIVMPLHIIDFDPNDSDSLDAWYVKVDSNEEKQNIREFHYSTPFLMEGCYVIQHTGSDHYYIYKPVDDNNGSWYCVERSFQSNEFKEKYKEYTNSNKVDLGEVLYYSHVDIIDAITNGCNEFNLILEFKNKKIIKCLPDMTRINLLQNDICNRLYREDIFSSPINGTFSFSEKVEAYRKSDYKNYIKGFNGENKMSSVEAFLELISKSEVTKNTVFYHNLHYFLPENLALPNIPVTYQEKKNLNVKLESLSSCTFSNLKQFNQKEKQEVIEYINKNLLSILEDVPKLKEYIDDIYSNFGTSPIFKKKII